MVVAQRGRGGVSRDRVYAHAILDDRLPTNELMLRTGRGKGPDRNRDLGENKVSPGSNCHVLVGKWSEMGLTHPHLTPTQIFILGDPYTCLFNLEMGAETHHPSDQ